MHKITLTVTCLLCLLLPGCDNKPKTVEQVAEEEKVKTIYIGIAWDRDWNLLIEGAELAVDQANASGGVLEKKIKLIIKQDEGKTSDILARTSSLMAGDSIKEYTRQVARSFIRHPQPITAVIGHRYSFMALSAASLYQQSNMLFIAPTATNELLTSMNFDSVFRMLPKNSVLGKQLAQYGAARGFKRVAIFHERSEYAHELSRALKEALAEQGIQTVLQHSFFSGMSGQEFSSYAMAFKEKHKGKPIDAVFLFVGRELARSIIREFYKRGVDDTVFLTGDGIDYQSFWKTISELQKELQKPIHIGVPTLFQVNSDNTRYFIDKFLHAYEQPPDSAAALGYDAMNILLAAVEQAGSSASDKVMSELRYMSSCQGITNSIAFQNNGDIVNKRYMIKWMRPTGFEYHDLNNQVISPDAQPKGLRSCVSIDRDKDGIINEQDVCPDNSREELTQGVFQKGDQLGCPVDTDNDEVPDYRDQCRNNTSEELDKGVNIKGCPKDRDKDQIPDYRDDCPGNTPKEISKGVTIKGCPLDTDQDGVPDYADACPNNTPQELKKGISKAGCSRDRDQDGVPDYWDKCPKNTAKELRFGVGRDGCPQDSDKDQHPDYSDSCRLDTEADLAQGTDEQGCPKDGDKDGVYDIYDTCPNTVQGMQVNKQGCPLVTVFTGNSFSGGTSTLSAEGKQQLQNFSRKFIPAVVERITVLVHTDGKGTTAFNQRLSEQRAAAVATLFMQEGIPQSALNASGAGESQPIADNETEEGRRKNRRIELTVRLKTQDSL